MKNILIVGCGYLGKRVAAAFYNLGWNVSVTTRSAENAKQFVSQGYTAFVCDVLNPESLTQLPASDVWLHAVGYDRQSSYSQRQVYVDGLQNLLAKMTNHCDQLIHISSTSIYGQTDGEWITETSPTNPTRENGQIVLAAEQLIRQSGLPAVVLRLAGIYGPDRLLSRVLQAENQTPIPGNPDAWLNLIHVADAVQVIESIVDRQISADLFLVSDNRPLTRREYYTTLAKLIKAPEPIFEPQLADPKGDRGLNKRCDNSKLRQKLLFELKYPTIADGLPPAITDSGNC